jgi:hypothetical protein
MLAGLAGKGFELQVADGFERYADQLPVERRARRAVQARVARRYQDMT